MIFCQPTLPKKFLPMYRQAMSGNLLAEKMLNAD
jgi:hypothetical protein